MKYDYLIVLISMNLFCQGQSVSTLMGARACGMGYASAVLKDEAALFNNPGAMAGNQASTFFAYEVNPELQGANRMAAGIQLPVKQGVVAFGIFRFGDKLYNEQLASMAFSNQFGIASLGFKLNYIQYQAEGYGTKNTIGLDFGGLAQITPQISAGAYIINLNQAEISPGERLPTKLAAGLGFKLEGNIFLSTEVEKDIEYPATYKAGFEYTIHKKVFVRSGFNLNTTSFHAGLGAQTKRLKIDYALKFSNPLGETHQASAVLLLAKRNK